MSEMTNVSILERLSNAETQLKQLGERFEGFSNGVQQFFKNYEDQRLYLYKAVGALVQTVNSLTELGADDLYSKLSENIKNPIGLKHNILQEQIDKNELEEARANQVAQERMMNQFLSEGKIYPVEKVSEKSIIVGKKFDKDGNEFEVNRIQIEFTNVPAEYKDRLLHQTIGAMIDDTDDTKIKITEIYEINYTAFAQSANKNSSQNLPN